MRGPFWVWHKFATEPFKTRAFVADFALGAGLKEDIIYPSAFFDGDGWALDGARQHVIHFDRSDIAMATPSKWT